MLNEVNVIPTSRIQKGPDTFRGSSGAIAFILTPHFDSDREDFFYAKNGQGHEEWITAPNMVEAMFGPSLHEPTEAQKQLLAEAPSLSEHHWKRKKVEENPNPTLRDELWNRTEIYKQVDGKYEPTGKYREYYAWDTVRCHSRGTTIYGRMGDTHGHIAIMLWPPPSDWEGRMRHLLEKLVVVHNKRKFLGVLEITKKMVICVNDKQYLAEDFLGT